jgi:hypothetical protein
MAPPPTTVDGLDDRLRPQRPDLTTRWFGLDNKRGMSDDRVPDIRRLLSDLADRMPMSEAEFRYRVEPLRAARETAVPLLLDLLGGESSVHGMAAAALHEIATPADTQTLTKAFRDPKRSERARAEIAQVLTGVAADQLERLLEPEEIRYLSLLSIDTLLDRLRDRTGMAQVVELYRGSPPGERRALLDAISVATARPHAQVRLGTALDPLFPHESDEALRTLMIQRVADRGEPAGARALRRWLARAHGAERRRVLEALRRLEHLGIRPAARSLEAWVSGADATGSFNVGISFPGALELRDIVLACISVDAGLRAVNLVTAVAPETTGEIGRALEEGQAIPVAPIDVPAALHHIEAARRRTIELGRALPEGFTLAMPYLRRPLAVAKPAAPASVVPRAPRGQLATLLDAPAYATWTFGGAELSMPRSLAGEGAPTSHRLRAAARTALRDLEGSAAAARLVAMLRHQSGVHRLRSETSLAARSLAAAREIEERGLSASGFARRMVERSMVASLIHGPKVPRSDVRDGFKRTIEETTALRRRAVATLDLAEALYRQLENLNERAAPSDRLTLAQMEAMAMAAAGACVEEFSRDASEQARLPGMEVPQTAPSAVVRRRIRGDGTRIRLEQRIRAEITVLTATPELAARLAAALVSAGRWFAEEVCLRRCRRGCLLDPESDGRALFFDRAHPAGLDLVPTSAESGRSAGGLALRQHLARRLDERIVVAAAFLEALEKLGLPARGDDRSRLRRAGELLERLRALRREVERIEEDPAWLYALVEETEQLVREVRTLHKHLLGAALGRLVPKPRQFESFQPYPQALVAWRRLERQTRRLGLIGLPLRSLHAAIDRFTSSAPLLALLRAVGEPSSAVALRRLDEATVEFWTHTPRSTLGSRTPAQTADPSTPSSL